jgi:hypothetical protein
VIIENPLGVDVQFAAHSSNKRNFSVSPDPVRCVPTYPPYLPTYPSTHLHDYQGPAKHHFYQKIWPPFTSPSLAPRLSQVHASPYGSVLFHIVYTPSSLSTQEGGMVTLSHPVAGSWVFEVQGMGQLPGVMAEQTPASTVGQLSSYMFPFKNPFPAPLSISVALRVDPPPGAPASADDDSASNNTTDDSAGAPNAAQQRKAGGEPGAGPSVAEPTFKLLLKKADSLALPAFGALQIPVGPAAAKTSSPVCLSDSTRPTAVVPCQALVP